MTGVMSWESMGIEFFEELRSGGGCAVSQPKHETKLLKKMTLVELQKVAIDRGISIFKKSEKTGKDLKKNISELREELENM
jgi:hypothetical protein